MRNNPSFKFISNITSSILLILGSCNHISNTNQAIPDSLQNSEYAADTTLGADSVKTKALEYNSIIVAGIKLGAKVNLVKARFKPDSIVNGIGEMDDSGGKKLYIKGSYFEISSDEQLVGFNITDKMFVFDTFGIKVGDKRQFVLDRLAHAINYQAVGNSGSASGNLSVRIGNSDDYLIFSFENDIMTRYSTWSDL